MQTQDLFNGFKGSEKSIQHCVTALAISAVALITLAACGGGGGGSSTANITNLTVPAALQANYVKVCMNGDVAGTGQCSIDPPLSTPGTPALPTDWGCTQDKATGLLWEVNSEHRNTMRATMQFTNYTTTEFLQKRVDDPANPGGSKIGAAPSQAEIDSMRNATGYKNWINGQALCGNTKWRIPKSGELQGIYMEHTYRRHLIPGRTSRNDNDYFVDKFFPNAVNEAYITSDWNPRAGTGRGNEDYYSEVVRFLGYGVSELPNYPNSLPERQTPYPLRLVADCNCKQVGLTQQVRDWGRSVLLPDDTVLTVGGNSTFAELFSTTTEQWTPAGAIAATDIPLLPTARHTASVMGGKVVVVGGVNDLPQQTGNQNKVWIYDIASQTWSKGQNSTTDHRAPAALAIDGSTLLVIGGDCRIGLAVACNSGSVEEYDVSSDAWKPRAPMPVPVHSSLAIKLDDGRILVAGGSNNFSSRSEVQFYDAGADAWAPRISNLNQARYYHTGTKLSDGRILITGGTQVSSGGSQALLKSVEIFDPATAAFTLAAPMNVARTLHTATLLADGRVMVAGGATTNSTNTLATPVDSVEIYDPKSNTWTLVCKLSDVRYAHNATMLADGKRILISGGRNATTPYKIAEIFTP